MSTAWQGTGAPAHAQRIYRANGTSHRQPGMFTRGNRGRHILHDDRPAILAADARYGSLALGDRVPVVAAHRPFRELPDQRVKVISRAAVCPGCGIVPPAGSGRKCDQCW